MKIAVKFSQIGSRNQARKKARIIFTLIHKSRRRHRQYNTKKPHNVLIIVYYFLLPLVIFAPQTNFQVLK